MKKQIIAGVILAVLTGTRAYAGCSAAGLEDSKCDTAAAPVSIANCKSTMADSASGISYSFCYKNDSGQYKKVYTCKECEDGYVRVPSHTLIEFGCNTSDIASMYSCQPCSVAKSCGHNDTGYPETYDSDAWEDDTWYGYQHNNWVECDTSTCTWQKKTKYRCADGYYGESDKIVPNYIEGFGIMGINGCMQCPYNALATKNGMSDAGNNETVQGCYLSEASGYDLTGTYKIVPEYARCYYD
ncbi:MAG: hypothetical protein NC311_05980 [Muribaculaceae bacterium]|nr:hypothetical protein [Muribaculaceae bacterium]